MSQAKEVRKISRQGAGVVITGVRGGRTNRLGAARSRMMSRAKVHEGYVILPTCAVRNKLMEFGLPPEYLVQSSGIHY